MKVKTKSEKDGLKLNIHKTNIIASGPITSWEIDGETLETVSDFIFIFFFFVVFLLQLFYTFYIYYQNKTSLRPLRWWCFTGSSNLPSHSFTMLRKYP